MKKQIVFVHILNNFSGSPNVLAMVIRAMVKRGYDVELITNRSRGFLSDISGVRYRYVDYRWCENSRINSLFYLVLAQIQMFFMVLFCCKRDSVYYINTIVHVGVAVACRLSGRDMIYHSHENMRQNKPLYGVYRTIYRWCNRKTIFVSKYVESVSLGCRDGKIIHNALDRQFLSVADAFITKNKITSRETILLVASLKWFKGVYEFVELAKMLPEYDFEMVCNATNKEVEEFLCETNAPQNIIVHPTQTNLHPYYQRSKLLLQLSDPKEWIETFGLTILEAMVYGVPSIVPNVGGPLELVEDGVNGFVVNPKELEGICSKVRMLMTDECVYEQFSVASFNRARSFDPTIMIDKIESYINEKVVITGSVGNGVL